MPMLTSHQRPPETCCQIEFIFILPKEIAGHWEKGMSQNLACEASYRTWVVLNHCEDGMHMAFAFYSHMKFFEIVS